MLASQENGLIFFLTQQQVWQVKATQSCLTNFQVRRLWGSLSLLQGIFPTQGSNPGILHCRQIPYQLSRKGSPRILEWVAYPFSRGSSWPRNRTGVSFIASRKFRMVQPLWKTSWPFLTGTSWIAQLVKNPPAIQETLVWFLGQKYPMEKG